MRYIRNRSHFSQKKSTPEKGKWVLLILVGIVAIMAGFLLFGGGEEEVIESLSQEVVEVEMQEEVATVDELSWTQETVLLDVEEAGGSGVARRGVLGDLFTHVIVADLPIIDTDRYFYEGWLVVPGVVEFFSTGPMFLREDGKWGLVWESELDSASDDLFSYREIVITREPYDDDSAPSPDHVLEGTFEEK